MGRRNKGVYKPGGKKWRDVIVAPKAFIYSNERDLSTIRNKEIYQELKSAMSRFHSVLGVRQQDIKIADFDKSVLGVHFTDSVTGKSDKILLNSAYFDSDGLTKQKLINSERSSYDAGWSTRTNKPIAHTITHELAHATWNSHLKSRNAQLAKGEIMTIYKNWQKDKNTSKLGYGAYSHTNVNEFWAEVVTKAMHGESDQYTKAIKKIIKRYSL